MEKLKFLKFGKEDSSGHVSEVTALDSVTLHLTGNTMFAAVQLNNYKNAEAKLAGKSSSIDRVRNQSLYQVELGVNLVELHNKIMESVAKKHNLEIVEIEGDIELRSPQEIAGKKEKK